jgi:hypothetical protein
VAQRREQRLRTVAATAPSCSISIVSVRARTFFLIVARTEPEASLSSNGLVQPQRLAVDEEDLVAPLVGDPESSADREQPFPDEITHTGQAI